jgi:hypothetical protein
MKMAFAVVAKAGSSVADRPNSGLKGFLFHHGEHDSPRRVLAGAQVE